MFLAIFRNEITTILTPSTLEGVSGGGNVFVLEVPDYESAMLVYLYTGLFLWGGFKGDAIPPDEENIWSNKII